ncbi:hypothetical protein T492DRAFT_912262 [Pavlovales sp. CCMP2436]|nr:hypothetical protein T492DRAFT_912262 [Pavlovales sp. CCMP2436]
MDVRALAGWVQIGNGEFYHRTNLAELGFLVSNFDIALSPEDVVTLSCANRAAQGGGNVCFGAGKTPALDIPQGRRRSAPDHTAKATSRAAATTLERLWEPLGAAIGHDELFNGQLRINVSDLVPHLDQRFAGVHVTIVISEGSLAAPLCLTRGATCYVDGAGLSPCTISLPIGPNGEAMYVQCVHYALCCPTDAREALQALEGAALSLPLPAVRRDKPDAFDARKAKRKEPDAFAARAALLLSLAGAAFNDGAAAGADSAVQPSEEVQPSQLIALWPFVDAQSRARGVARGAERGCAAASVVERGAGGGQDAEEAEEAEVVERGAWSRKGAGMVELEHVAQLVAEASRAPPEVTARLLVPRHGVLFSAPADFGILPRESAGAHSPTSPVPVRLLWVRIVVPSHYASTEPIFRRAHVLRPGESFPLEISAEVIA